MLMTASCVSLISSLVFIALRIERLCYRRRSKNRANRSFPYSLIADVCLSGLQLIMNIPSITTTCGIHPLGRYSITTGRCGSL